MKDFPAVATPAPYPKPAVSWLSHAYCQFLKHACSWKLSPLSLSLALSAPVGVNLTGEIPCGCFRTALDGFWILRRILKNPQNPPRPIFCRGNSRAKAISFKFIEYVLSADLLSFFGAFYLVLLLLLLDPDGMHIMYPYHIAPGVSYVYPHIWNPYLYSESCQCIHMM